LYGEGGAAPIDCGGAPTSNLHDPAVPRPEALLGTGTRAEVGDEERVGEVTAGLVLDIGAAYGPDLAPSWSGMRHKLRSS